MNFFRQLAGALIVAAFGAIVLGGAGLEGQPGLTLETLANAGPLAAGDLADVFRWVFVTAAALLSAGLVLLVLMEERPLRGRRRKADVPVAAE